MIAVLEAQRAGLFRREHIGSNLLAGTIVGVVALPLAMAFAIATGAKPEQGLYTAIIAALAVSLFGGSRVQIAGPTGAFVVVLSGIVAQYGLTGLQLASLMAGVLLMAMGFLRMGALLRFIPAPVITGFTAGIGVVIWVGQWPAFFGIPSPKGEHFHQKLPELFRELAHPHVATTLLGMLGIVLVLLPRRIPALQRVPGPLVALVIVTVIQAIGNFDGVATIGTAFGGIPQGLPSLTMPEWSFDLAVNLIPSAVTIAMLGAIESLLSAVVADGMAGTRHNSNQELVGQGVANVASSMFGGIAATGAIARTATNVRNGGTSPLAGITHSVVLLAIILVLAPLASSVPLTALAAILFVVAWNMSEVRHVVRMARRAPIADVGILLVTFVLTVMADLVIAVNVGVLLATLQFLRRMASSVDVVPHQNDGSGNLHLPVGVMAYSIEGPFFFAAVESFERALATTGTDPDAVIIRLGNVPFIDITGIHALEDVIDDLESRGVCVALCEANVRVTGKMVRAGLAGSGERIRLVSTLDDAVALVQGSQPKGNGLQAIPDLATVNP